MGRDFDIHRSDDDNGEHLHDEKHGYCAEFINVYRIKLLAGRNFDNTDYNADFNKLHNIIINENAVKLLGFISPNDAIGKTITMFGKQWDVIGVINDYHQKSLRYAMEPLILHPFYSTNNAISVKVNTKNLPATIAQI